ncbi:MAG: ethylbenzene dehydrogenase-related protein [Motiliproteus sp.]
MNRMFGCGLIAGLFLAQSSLSIADTLSVAVLDAAPTIDGVHTEWATSLWQEVQVHPAKEGDKKNRTGELTVRVAAGVYGDQFYFAAQWPDKTEDLAYKSWRWKGKKYKRGKQRDDMFALRFDMGGDFNSCMVSDANYEVDVWVWSAGRSNKAGLAEDMWHLITLDELENAAEYKTDSGNTVYIKKGRDEGSRIYVNNKPDRKKNQGKELPGIIMTGTSGGSLADVKAKGVWKDNHWFLEYQRKLDTGNADDAVLPRGGQIRGQLAVFNKGYAEHKSVSEELVFELPE